MTVLPTASSQRSDILLHGDAEFNASSNIHDRMGRQLVFQAVVKKYRYES